MSELNISVAIHLLEKANELGVKLLLEGDELTVNFPKGKQIDAPFLEELRANKTHLLAYLKEQGTGKGTRILRQRIETLSDHHAHPKHLSFGQERLWIMDQLMGSVEYHSPALLKLVGGVDETALQSALRSIVNRHGALRTVIRQIDGHPAPVMLDQDLWQLEVQDVTNLTKNISFEEHLQQFIKKPFDLSQDHMIRAELIRFGNNVHRLLVVLHHIASDAWSMPIIIRDLNELYAAKVAGRPANLPLLPYQYTDFATWQRKHLSGQTGDQIVHYWQQQLKDAPLLDLPTDHARTAVRNIEGDAVTISITKDLTDQLISYSRKKGASLYMTLLSVFKVLLFRYSGQNDISVGSSIAGRLIQEVEGMVGFFANTLVLRSHVDGSVTFSRLLEQVKQTTLDAFDNQELPFEKLVESLGVQRDLSRNPLFQVMFVMENTGGGGQMDLGGVTVMEEGLPSSFAKFDITMNVTQLVTGLKINLIYRKDLYLSETMARMLDHYRNLLDTIVSKDAEEVSVGHLPMMSSSELTYLIEEANTSTVKYPRDKTIVDLFCNQAIRTPDAIAVECENRSFTFAELDRRSDQLAYHLRDKGLVSEMLVPVCLERGIEMVLAILAVMKAGGAYVPVDPAFPIERICYLLEDTSASIVISEKRILSWLDTTRLHFLDLSEPLPETDLEADERFDGRPTSGQLAYVIYTSGSTGRPKGVMIQHDHLVDYVFGLRARTNIPDCKSFALVSTLATDLGNTVIYASLISGGVLHIFPRDVISDAEVFQKYFASRDIDCMKIVPSHWNALSTTSTLLPARLLIFGGEALPVKWIRNLQQTGTSCKIVNHYGPTETTIGKLLHVIDPASDYSSQNIPIGKPFSNTRCYILSAEMELCPIGTPGELYIEGDGVARGYYGRHDLTAERFVPNPFVGSAGARIYRTGDMARMLHDGNIVYLGRVDDQVKINGNRIELGEIENALRQSGKVKQAVAGLSQDVAGNSRLVAWLVPDGRFNREEILTLLKNWLPDYMIPSSLVELERLPLTLNGKIDKRSLPAPNMAAGDIPGNDLPINSLEEKLLEIWLDMLELEKIGINDNFFQLGGNSLLAIRLLSAIRKQLSLEINIGDVFDHPTVRDLAAKLSSAKIAVAPLTVGTRPQRIPLSFSQERLWFIDQLEGSMQYHVPAVLRMKGPVNTDALAYALETIVQRHEVLRTVIRTEDGQPYQEILPSGTWRLNVIWEPGLIDHDALRSKVTDLINKPFDLSADHNVRADLFCIAEDEYLLVFVLHHIASDAWSTPIMIREIMELYDARVQLRQPILPTLPLQYADYSVWQRSNLTDDALAEKLAYWQKSLSGVTPIPLPLDYPRPDVLSNRGGVVSFTIDDSLTQKIRTLSNQHDVTLFMTLLTVFQVLLYRHSGQPDICIGSPMASRQPQELEALIGFFINTLVFRGDLSGNPSFINLLSRTRALTLEAYTHHEVPFEKVVDAAAAPRDRGRSPLFDVKIALNNIPHNTVLSMGDKVELTLEELPLVQAQLDLSLDIVELTNIVRVALTYCADLYRHDTIARMADHFIQLLHAVTDDPTCHIDDLPILTDREMRSLLDQRGPKVSYPKGQSLVSWFREVAKAEGGEVALVYEQQELSYAELNKRSDKLAGYLVKLGVGPGTLVPICVERGMEMIIGILGVLKAGGAYVPIDAEYPQERVSYMLEDTGAWLVLVSRATLPVLEGAVSGKQQIIILNDNWEEHSEGQVLPQVSADSLAYVIYTSGSTGRPKGVMVEHRHVVNLVHNQAEPLSLRRGQRVLQFASFGFDASCHEIFCTLLWGGRLILCGKDRILDPFLFSELLDDEQVELVTLPPSYQLQLGEELPYLKTIISAGEALNVKAATSIMSRGIRLINAYGPTENTVSAILTQEPLDEQGRVRIGKPIANVEIYIVNESMSLQPVGVPGEICIGGSQVARGYLNQERLTTQKFLANPFSEEPGARLYRSGDMGRWLEDGNIEYLGRRDEQVKIRGYRIELGEIEQVALQSGLVRQAAVVVREDGNGNRHLVGYAAAGSKPAEERDDQVFDKEGMIQWLQSRLPEYMVPQIWLALKELPLTTSGKVDRKGLPDPDVEGRLESQYIAPRNRMEEQLVEIWQELLDNERIGINDDFFELGGHSILAIKVISTIRKRLELELSIGELFNRPTIGLLSELLSDMQSRRDIVNRPVIQPRDQSLKIPLSYSQERLWFIHQLEGSIQYNIPLVVRLKGALNVEALSTAFRTILQRHEVLRTVILEEEGQPYQELLTTNHWNLAVLQCDESGLQETIAAFIRIPFDLSKDYKLRVNLISLDKEEYVLIIVLHHIASDGWSMPILVNELSHLYKANRAGVPHELPQLTVQYADYAIWQRKYLQGALLDKELKYWEAQLKGLANLNLPTDHARPVRQNSRGGTISFRLDEHLTHQLGHLSQEHGATLFMTLLSAFKILLYRYSDQTDVCVGSAAANRGQNEIEGLIGFFVNPLALRSDLSGNPSFIELLQRVRTTTLGAYEHQDTPFEKIVGAVIKDRDMGRNPIFQVMFDLQQAEHTRGEEEVLVGMDMRRQRVDHVTSKFDLTYTLTEWEGGIEARVEYNLDLHEKASMLRMAAHYEQLLRSIAANPWSGISQLQILPASEEKQLLRKFNRSPDTYAPIKTVLDLFRQQASRDITGVAVIQGARQMTYGELDQSSDNLACYLKNLGVHTGTLVPTCLERGLEMLIGIFGILKAGGAYVPIDPSYPRDRVKYILQDTAAKVVVTSRANLELLVGSMAGSLQTIVLDEEDAHAYKVARNQVLTPVLPVNLAYVIYTSGSTGRPKGVMVEHANLVSYITNEQAQYTRSGVNPGAGTYLHLSYTFDASVTSLFQPLLAGRPLVLAPAGLDAVELLTAEHLLAGAPYDFIKLTPAHLPMLEPVFASGRRLTDRLVIGGEALLQRQLQYLIDTGVSIEVVNEYGPTEATVGCTTYRLHTDDAVQINRIREGRVSIGKPMRHTSIYILNSSMGLQPIGVPGEICIGGPQVARGYLNQETLTSQKFVANPFSEEVGARLYKTGDIGRWLSDGNIEYLGRRDEQVKIRGYRIELGEIEHVLLQSGLLREAVVVAREDVKGNKQLVGYVVANNTPDSDTPSAIFDKMAVTSWLKDHLPEYMVPQVWMLLPGMPLTSNGKVDRKNLPEPDETGEQAEQYVAPRNDIEQRLVEIWEDLLYKDHIGINDNFFEVGGDSIISIQVVSRARRYGYELQVGDIFSYQTIASLSEILSQRSDLSIKVVAEQGILTGSSGLLPVQQWFFSQDQESWSHFNQSILLSVSKDVGAPRLEAALRELGQFHDALRFHYSHEEGNWRQQYGGYNLKLDREDLRNVAVEELDAAIQEKSQYSQQSLNINKGPLLRAVLIETPNVEHRNRLLIVVHHLAVDTVSWRILVDDLSALLETIDFRLGRKTTSYRQWHEALVSYGKSRRLQQQQLYWKLISDAYRPLPVDKQFDGAIRFKERSRHISRLGVVSTQQLLHETPKAFRTEINDLLLAALARTLLEWTGHQSVNIGLEGHGREDSVLGWDSSRTVGWFTSMYPVMLCLEAGCDATSPADWIRSTKELLRRIPDKGLGYGVLKYINQAQDLQGVTPWDLVFNYLGQFDNVTDGKNLLQVASESTGTGIADSYRMPERLSVNSRIHGGELVLQWNYSSLHYEKATIEMLAQKYIGHLEEMVSECFNQGRQFIAPTPSDFGLAGEIGILALDNFYNEQQNGNRRGPQLETICRLSGLQQGLLFHAMYDKESHAYLEQLSCDLVDLKVPVLLRSWSELIAQHSILRTGFYPDHFSLPIQVVFKTANMPIEELDYRNLSPKDRHEAVSSYEHHDRQRPFDVTSAPLMRLGLLRLTEDRYRMVWTHHHIILDGWSVQVLISELLAIYESLANGAQLPPHTPDRYEDYIRHLKNVEIAQEEAYWRNYLARVDQGTLLPFISGTGHRNNGVGEYRQDLLLLDRQLTEVVERYTQRHRLTVNTIMQGVWSYLLSRYTGNEKVVYGVTVSGRPEGLSGIESRVGLYINTLPLHTVVQNDDEIVSWLNRLQHDQQQSREYQHTALSTIQQWLGVQGDMFDSLLVFGNYPVNKVIASRRWLLQAEHAQINEHTNYPLTIIISASDEVRVQFKYNSTLLNEDYIKRVKGHFEQLVRQIVLENCTTIGQLQLLARNEEHQLLKEFNATEMAYAADKTVVDLFREQVARDPQAVAVSFGQERLSYLQLDERSDGLARYLNSQGVDSRTLVPICIERGVGMLTGILGILKAGAAYVPIDPDYPADRVSYMLEDTGARLVVSSGASRKVLTGNGNYEVISLDQDWEQIIGAGQGQPLPAQDAQGLAYVIYTSGSTGRPKGVMVGHRSLNNFLTGIGKELGFKQGSSLLAVTTYSFDISYLELYLPLLHGGQVIVASREMAGDGYLLCGEIALRRPDYMQATPSGWQILLGSGWRNAEGMKLLVGGEALQEPIKDALTECGEVWNLYGPTETTIWSTSEKLDRGRKVTIGRPIANTQIHIVDREGRLTPIGVPGELCIAGAGLAHGYLHQEELTAEKFVANPFSEQAGARLYRTGDMGRWLPDGRLEYLGRGDDQVKIRGYRIELGEIERVTLQSGLVSQAVVVARPDPSGTSRLVGYVILHNEPDATGLTFSKAGMIRWLERYLPEYMIPQLWVELEELPLTSNGKIDRRKLLEMDVSAQLIRNYVAPGNTIEKRLVDIWQQVLNIQRIGTNDNFFEAGGNSILVMRLTAAVHQQLQVQVPMGEIFKHPTIAELAQHITAELQGSRPGARMSLIVAQERPLRIPLSYSQERLWFIDQLEGSVQYHIPMVVRLNGSVNREALGSALKTIVQRHEALRTVILQEEGQPYQQVLDPKDWQLGMEQGIEAQWQQKIEELVLKPFDLSKDYCLRADLIDLGHHEHRLVVVLHHIASDAWSMPILVNELRQLYRAYNRREPFALSNLPVQYADYAIWQRQDLQGATLENKLSYWRDKLMGVEILRLPTDHIRPVVQSNRGGVISFNLDSELTRQLEQLGQKHGATLFMTLLTTFKVLLYRYSGQTDICVGTTIANRGQYEIEKLIGFFVNTLALRSDLSGDPSFTELLQRVRLTTLGAYEHQETPFEKIVDAVVRDRELNRNPLIQVLFEVLHVERADHDRSELEGLELSELAAGEVTAKFDLTYSLSKRQGALYGRVEYSLDVYEEATMVRMAGHYEQLLRSIVSNPEASLGQLNLLTASEQRQLLHDFNATDNTYTAVKTIIDLFLDQVKTSPDKVAVTCNSENLTYRELNQYANQLADYLVTELNIGTEDVVAMQLERSQWALVTILGIFKARAAYLPIDPDYPEERIAYMRENAGCKLVIDELELRRFQSRTHELSKDDPTDRPAASNLAYVIYTSGSTGEPKGAMIEHRGMLNHTLAFAQIASQDENSRIAQNALFTFDVSVWQLLNALITGGTTVIYNYATILDPDLFMRRLISDKITILEVVPSYLKSMLDLLGPANGMDFNDLRYLFVTGEPISQQLLTKWFSRYPSTQVVNVYGPTEASDDVTYYTMDKAPLTVNTPIGRPIQNMKVYILDLAGRLCPIGVVGEICVSGVGVGRGYIGDEAKTKAKFVPDPFENGVMYRTGDLGRWLSDGNIEYLGRHDEQVKIRGHRIELGEIENAILLSGQAIEVVVLANRDATGEPRLVGYVVASETFDRKKMLAYLRIKLPEYMVPQVWVELETIPLTANGKIDRKKLPKQDLSSDLEKYVAPVGQLETWLATLWSELLEIDRVGTEDDFFELGGHSLLVMKVMSSLRKELNLNMPIKLFFELKTIAALAVYIEAIRIPLHITDLESRKVFDL